jgi:hypothetical protein
MWRPMLLILVEHIMVAASGRPSPNEAVGLRSPATSGDFIMCSADIKSIGLRTFQTHWPPILSKALAIHMLLNPHVLKTGQYEPVNV